MVAGAVEGVVVAVRALEGVGGGGVGDSERPVVKTTQVTMESLTHSHLLLVASVDSTGAAVTSSVVVLEGVGTIATSSVVVLVVGLRVKGGSQFTLVPAIIKNNKVA